MLIASMLVGCSGASDQPAGDLRQQLIDTYIGGLSSAQQIEMLTAQGRIIEDEINRCMTTRGFKYEPFYAAYVPSADGAERLADFSDEKYASEHGFGLVDSFVMPPDAPDDPNAGYTQSLTTPQQGAYYQALDGVPDASGFDPSSCRAEGQRAFEEAVGGAGFDAQLRLAADQALASGEVQAAAVQWQQCALSRGYDFPSRRDLITHVDQLIAEVTGQGPRDLDAPLDPEIGASLDGVRKYEVAAATATFECSQPYDRVLRETLIARLQSA
jgi:hypothetical protein